MMLTNTREKWIHMYIRIYFLLNQAMETREERFLNKTREFYVGIDIS